MACRHAPLIPASPTGAPPAYTLGTFEDDYRGRHVVTAASWQQGTRSHYRIVRWMPDQRYLIAQNDSANPSDGGRWTRIDWIRLDGMPPYTWAFCFSAYNAPSAAAAESTTVARPDTPRTGCNGFPFSRMKPTT